MNAGLAEKWSPKQISERLREEHPGDLEMRVSHETIYECLYLQARGELRTQLKLALRQGRTRRVNRSRMSSTRVKITSTVSISERPKEAEDRAVPGFWEGDLIIGKGNKSQIATLVERMTRFVMLVRIPYDRNAERVAYLLAKKMETLPEFMRNSVTWIGERRWPDMPSSRCRRACRSISATRIRRDSGAVTRILMGCCGNTFRRDRTCRCIPRTSLIESLKS